jgi:hypothetical protein
VQADGYSIIRRIQKRAAVEHWPKPSAGALVYQAGATVLSNGYLAWLVLQRQLSPVALALFCVCELLLLAVMSKVERIPVPRHARFPTHDHGLLGSDNVFGRLLAGVLRCLFAAVWLSLTYGFSLWADENLGLVFADRDALDVLARLHVLGPLFLCVVLALGAMIGDWRLWRRRGILFVPESAAPTVPKTLSLFLAPIPAAMACFTFIDDDPSFALFAWCVAYLAIKCLCELGMLGLEIFGMWILGAAKDDVPEDVVAVAQS